MSQDTSMKNMAVIKIVISGWKWIAIGKTREVIKSKICSGTCTRSGRLKVPCSIGRRISQDAKMSVADQPGKYRERLPIMRLDKAEDDVRKKNHPPYRKRIK
jgi:hypothetical protein